MYFVSRKTKAPPNLIRFYFAYLLTKSSHSGFKRLNNAKQSSTRSIRAWMAVGWADGWLPPSFPARCWTPRRLGRRQWKKAATWTPLVAERSTDAYYPGAWDSTRSNPPSDSMSPGYSFARATLRCWWLSPKTDALNLTFQHRPLNWLLFGTSFCKRGNLVTFQPQTMFLRLYAILDLATGIMFGNRRQCTHVFVTHLFCPTPSLFRPKAADVQSLSLKPAEGRTHPTPPPPSQRNKIKLGFLLAFTSNNQTDWW